MTEHDHRHSDLVELPPSRATTPASSRASRISRHFDCLVFVGCAVLALSANVQGHSIRFLGVPSGGGQGNISRTDPSCTVSGGTITCPNGGVLVQFSLFAAGWADDIGPEIESVRATVDGDTLHNGLHQVLPLGYDTDRTIGAYQVVDICFMGASDGLACGEAGTGPFGPGLPGVNEPECQADGGLLCYSNADFITACCDPDGGVATPTDLAYLWVASVGPHGSHWVADDGTLRYFGDFVLEVPNGARGEWTISWLDDISSTSMYSGGITNLPVEELLPAILRIWSDCDENGIDDIEDIANGTSLDCNNNGIPDECNVVSGDSSDCNDNGVPDECEEDSDGDGIIDGCDHCPGANDAVFGPECIDAIPTVSTWGLVALTLLLLVLGKLCFRRRSKSAC